MRSQLEAVLRPMLDWSWKRNTKVIHVAWKHMEHRQLFGCMSCESRFDAIGKSSLCRQGFHSRHQCISSIGHSLM